MSVSQIMLPVVSLCVFQASRICVLVMVETVVHKSASTAVEGYQIFHISYFIGRSIVK